MGSDFRLPAELKERVQREAQLAGISYSEYIRNALIASLAWLDAVRAVEAGIDPQVLSSPERMIALLGELNRRPSATEND